MVLESIRKFGLEYCDLPTIMGNLSFMLRALLLNVDVSRSKPIPFYMYIWAAVVACSYFYVYFVSMIWFVCWRCWENGDGDLLAALIVFSLGLSSEIGPMKLIYIYLNNKKVQTMVSECLACDALITPNSRFANNIVKTLRVVKKRAIFFWIVIVMNGFLYVIKPLLTPGRHFMDDVVILYGLEPMYESPNFEISFMLMVFGVICSCYLPANVTAFLIVITGYVEARMLALSEELNHLWEDANTECDNQPNKTEALNKYVTKRLKEIIEGHAATMSLIKQVESIFRGAIAIEFLLLIVGLIAELLGGLQNTYMQVPYALLQVAMDCLTGQRVMDASLEFEMAVYACKWENFNKKNMKTVQIMLQSAQNRMKLTAGWIATLSFTCLMSVIRSIYSAYTTLRSTME